MNREIKFRAWDGKIMFKNVGIHPHMIKSLVKRPNCKEQDSDCEYNMYDEGSIIVSPAFTSYTIMQFTGLLDKNGVEIYEGDIFNMGDKNILYVTEWIGCGLFGRQISNKSFVGFNYWISKIEVIGNIFQNEELLKQENL